jgi:hypothetical protein
MNTPTPTPRTDLLTAKHWGDGFAAKYLKPLMQAMERELTAVTEQRDGLRSGIDYASDQLTRVTEQRDRLAEALKYQKELNEWIENTNPEDPFFDEGLRLGLNHASDLATEALAAVKGGSDES